MRNSFTISRYLIGAIVPYFVSAWLLLSVVLFVQQASRFSDIFFSVNIPTSLVWQLAFALIPNVIAFTAPMAVLVGTIIGLTKMQGDSELTAIRAAGVGTVQIVLPVLLLGIVLSGFTFLINLYGVPFAARVVRQVAMQTAIYKLESPIEPGVFNTEVAGYTIYVKDGDIANGKWKNIFIHTQDPATGTVRLITSTDGRIDSTGQLAELVLSDAVATTITPDNNEEKFVSERIGEVRFAIRTRRSELIEKLGSTESSVEELGLTELSEYAKTKDGRERTEAEILWQRRILLSLTPIIFCLLGVALVLRFNRSSNGFAITISLVSLITYYLLAFLGEQLARTGRVGAIMPTLLPVGVSVVVLSWLVWGRKVPISNKISGIGNNTLELFRRKFSGRGRRSLIRDVTAGLRDFDLLLNLLFYYLLTLGFLASIFIIFTAFELWRFAGTIDGGVAILLKYLVFLFPFIYIQLAPSAAMIATLATYVIKSRQNEIVTWTSAGQSVYRLLVPCFAFMIVLGGFNWIVQETIAPRANFLQDTYRQMLRSRGEMIARPVRLWVANDERIYAFSVDNSPASDNEKKASDLAIYEFADNGELQALYRSTQASWVRGILSLSGVVKVSSLQDGKLSTSIKEGQELLVATNPFKELRKKPSQLSTRETYERIENSESDLERRSFQVSLQRKWATLILPFVIALFTAPFALSLDRKGKAATVGYAVGIWLVFMAITSSFEQLGMSGFIGPSLAVWAPLLFFAMLGVYLLSKVKT